MEKEKFITALTELTAGEIHEKENVADIHRAVNELRQSFEDHLMELTRQYQIAAIEAREKGEVFDDEDPAPSLKEKFYAIYNPYRDSYKAYMATKKQNEEKNLQQKRSLINRLREVVENQKNIGAAFSAQKEINEEWKTIGSVPSKLSREIQHEYSKLLEDFFYNINIYKEIKDYDFQKNFTLKKEIIDQLNNLTKENDLTKVQEGLRSLQDAWGDIGPTKQELWDEIKEEYWAAVNAVYEKIRAFYDKRRTERKENLEKKHEIIAHAKELLEKESKSTKDWNKQTEQLIALQKQWKATGFGPTRKEDNAAWKEFRAVCDVFFAQKNTFFEGLNDEFDKIAQQKQIIIEKANELKNSTDWGETTKAIIRLQKEWQKGGSAGHKQDQKLWKKFRTACDIFFNAKDAHFKEQELAFEENLKQKEAIIEEMEQFELPKEQKEALAELSKFSERFATVGFVPKTEKDRIFKKYKAILNKHYDSLDLKGAKKEEILFKAKLNTIKGSSDASAEFQKEKQQLRNQINTIRQEINQLENNLGFFKYAKDNNPLKMQVVEDINKQNEKILALKAKLKLIPNE